VSSPAKDRRPNHCIVRALSNPLLYILTVSHCSFPKAYFSRFPTFKGPRLVPTDLWPGISRGLRSASASSIFRDNPVA